MYDSRKLWDARHFFKVWKKRPASFEGAIQEYIGAVSFFETETWSLSDFMVYNLARLVSPNGQPSFCP